MAVFSVVWMASKKVNNAGTWKICEQAERSDITLCLTETGKVEIISELSNSHITEIALK